MNNFYDIFIERTTDNTSSGILVNENNYSELWSRVQDFMATDPTYDYTVEDSNINAVIMWSVIFNNIITQLKYENVLVVPSFRDSNFTSLMGDDGQLRPNLINNIWPFVNAHFKCNTNVYVAYPDNHNSFARNMMREFAVNRISSNKTYVMGDDSYMVDVPDDIRFDCVLLSGISMNDGESFDVNDIKTDFSPVCTEGFDLIDNYDSVSREIKQAIIDNEKLPTPTTRLVGERKDMSQVAEHINNSIHIKEHLVENEKDIGNLELVLSRLSEVIKKAFRVY